MSCLREQPAAFAAEARCLGAVDIIVTSEPNPGSARVRWICWYEEQVGPPPPQGRPDRAWFTRWEEIAAYLEDVAAGRALPPAAHPLCRESAEGVLLW